MAKHILTGEKLKILSRTSCVPWILSAWDSISEDTIIRSFKFTGISNAIDGTKNDFIWELNDWLEENSRGECGTNFKVE